MNDPLFQEFLLAYAEMEREQAAAAYLSEHPEEAEESDTEDPEPAMIEEAEETAEPENEPAELSLFEGVDNLEEDGTVLQPLPGGDFPKPVFGSVEDLASGKKTGSTRQRSTRILQDFGEKIGGARKDAFAMYRLAMKNAQDITADFNTLKDAWPKPNYQKIEKENLIEPWKLAALRALREVISAKPKKYYENSWRKDLLKRRDLANSVLDDSLDQEAFEDQLRLLVPYSADNCTLSLNDWKHTRDLYQMYLGIGHEFPLESYRIGHAIGDGVDDLPVPYFQTRSWRQKMRFRDDSVRFANEIVSGGRSGYFYPLSRDAETAGVSSMEDVIALVQEDVSHAARDKAEEKAEKAAKEGKTGKSTSHWVSFRVGRDYEGQPYCIYTVVKKHAIPLKDGFATFNDADAYIDAHRDELTALAETCSDMPNERGDKNEARKGEAYLQGDVTPEVFHEAFDFYGVEFGNWVEGDKRQKDLNETYDAVLDLSKATGIPSQAISLGSTLSLRFGSNGRGGKNPAKAHYESLYKAINLTKRNGAGSLAHEWFHALDNYLGTQAGTQFLSKYMYTHYDYESLQGNGVQDGVLDAFSKVMDAISSTRLPSRSSSLDSSGKKYWASPEEMAARSFEAYVKDKLDKDFSIRNDFLVNICSEASFYSRQGPVVKQQYEESLKSGKSFEPAYRYPYPRESEMPAISEAFDNLFAAIRTKTKEDSRGSHIALYSSSDYASLSKEKALAVRVPLHQQTKDETTLQVFSERVLGLSVCFTEDTPTLHGVYDKEENTIYLNRNSEEPLGWVLSHEAFHALRAKDPMLYHDLLQHVEEAEPFSQEQMDAYRRMHHAPDLPDDTVKEEILADSFASREEQRHMIHEMAQKDAPLAIRVMNYTKKIASRALAFFRIRHAEPLHEKQAEAFHARLDEISSQMQVNGKPVLSDIHNVLGPDGLPMTAEEARKRAPKESYATSTLKDQIGFDVEMASQLLKKYSQEVVLSAIYRESPRGREPEYARSVVSQAMKSRQAGMTH